MCNKGLVAQGILRFPHIRTNLTHPYQKKGKV